MSTPTPLHRATALAPSPAHCNTLPRLAPRPASSLCRLRVLLVQRPWSGGVLECPKSQGPEKKSTQKAKLGTAVCQSLLEISATSVLPALRQVLRSWQGCCAEQIREGNSQKISLSG